MGGVGSGRWFRPRERVTTEDLPRIDIREMKKQRNLFPNYPGAFSWTDNDPASGQVSYEIHRGWLRIEYFADCGNHMIELSENVEFDSTACHFGGERHWFLCPGCTKRVASLYKFRNLYRCRHCHSLAFRSQSETHLDRLIRKSRKKRQQLGCYDSMFIPIMKKPKGMHLRTYKALFKEERAVSIAAFNGIEEITCQHEQMESWSTSEESI